MKLKSVVFTVAFAAASSAFAGTAYLESVCFTTNSTQTASIMTDGTFATELNAPIVITNEMSYTGVLTLDSYRITAYMTNLVVHATLPDAIDVDDKKAKGAICAVTNDWYGLQKDGESTLKWTELEKVAEDALYAPKEGDAYIFVTSFSAGAETVHYEVRNPVDNSLVASNTTFITLVGHEVAPSRFAFAGTGAYTNLVAEFIVSIDGSTAVRVEDGTGMIAVDESDNYDDIRTDPDTPAANGLKKWVNYVLGINGSTATAKPYAAPVQNNQADKLTFALGGVNVREKSATGADVEYTIEECADSSFPSAVPSTVVGHEYQSHGTTFEINAPEGVKYYRVLIKITPVQ